MNYLGTSILESLKTQSPRIIIDSFRFDIFSNLVCNIIECRRRVNMYPCVCACVYKYLDIFFILCLSKLRNVYRFYTDFSKSYIKYYLYRIN